MELRPYLRYLVIALLVLGIFFRFANLDQKVYWVDEVFTSLRLSGYSEQEVASALYQNPLITAATLETYQYPSPTKSMTDTIQGLATQEPQLSPLYFMATRLWVQLFGHSIVVTRSLSAVFSTLALPCLYWLCLELFGWAMVGEVAVGLMAVAPFHVIYAQEARPYSLWALTTVLSSWALLRAVRSPKPQTWLLYTLTLTLGLYTFLYTILVGLGHGIYVLCHERFRLTKTVQGYLLAAGGGLLLFTPWLVVLWQNWGNTASYTAWQQVNPTYGVPELVVTWALNLTRLFVDFDLNYNFSFANLFPYILVILGVVGLVIHAAYFCSRNAIWSVRYFLLTLIGTTGLVISLPDLILGGQRSLAGRYFVPCYIGIGLVVAYLLASKLDAERTLQRRIWQWMTLAIFSLGVLSCVNSLSAETWWNKEGGNIPIAADLINQASNPLVINELDWWLFSLSHSLKPDTPILVFDRRTGVPTLPGPYSDYFLFNASPSLIETLQQSGYQITAIETLENDPLLLRLNLP